MIEILEKHHQIKKNLLQIIADLKKIEFFTAIDCHTRIADLYERLQNEKFIIVVVGEFSSGKSTFLNALMGEKILPSAVAETTATINFIYSIPPQDPRVKQAHLYYLHGAVEKLNLEDEKQRKIFIDKTTALNQESHAAREIEKVEIYYPMAQVTEDVLLVDTPGLQGMAEGHREITCRQIDESHACIYIVSYRGLTGADGNMLKFIGSKFDKLFVIMNQIDLINPSETSVEDQKQRVLENLLAYQIFPENKVPVLYPISSFHALVSRSRREIPVDGRVPTGEEKQELFHASGIAEFEQALYPFITQTEKTKTMFTRTVDQVNDLIALGLERIAMETARFEKELQLNQIQKQVMEELLARYQRNFDDLAGFIKSECNNILKEFEKSLQELSQAELDRAEAQLDTIKTRQDLNDANKKRRIQEDLKKGLNTLGRRLEEYLQNGMEHLKRLSLEKRDKLLKRLLIEFSVVSAAEKVIVKISLAGLQVSVSVNSRLEREIEVLATERGTLRQNIQEVEARVEKKRSLEGRLQSVEYQIDRTNGAYSSAINSLGYRPSEKVETYYETVERKRGGTGFLDWLIGPKKETVSHTVRDDSAGEAWDRRRDSIRYSYTQDLNRLERERGNLSDELSNYVTAPNEYERLVNRLTSVERSLQSKEEEAERELDRLTQQALTQKKEEISNMLQKDMNEYQKDLNAQARSMMNDFQQKLIGAMNEDFRDNVVRYQSRLEHGDPQTFPVAKYHTEKSKFEQYLNQLRNMQQRIELFRKEL